jgi:hypothetical protein
VQRPAVLAPIVGSARCLALKGHHLRPSASAIASHSLSTNR